MSYFDDPDVYAADEAEGDPRFRQEPSMDLAPRLAACPECSTELNPERPTHTCPVCGVSLRSALERRAGRRG